MGEAPAVRAKARTIPSASPSGSEADTASRAPTTAVTSSSICRAKPVGASAAASAATSAAGPKCPRAVSADATTGDRSESPRPTIQGFRAPRSAAPTGLGDPEPCPFDPPSHYPSSRLSASTHHSAAAFTFSHRSSASPATSGRFRSSAARSRDTDNTSWSTASTRRGTFPGYPWGFGQPSSSSSGSADGANPPSSSSIDQEHLVALLREQRPDPRADRARTQKHQPWQPEHEDE